MIQNIFSHGFALSLMLATLLAPSAKQAFGNSEGSHNAGAISLGVGTNIQWSPGGAFLSFVSEGHLQVYDLQGAQRRDVGEIMGHEYAWVTENQIIDMSSKWDSVSQTFANTLYFYSLGDTWKLVLDSAVNRDFAAETPPKLLKTLGTIFVWGINKDRAVDVVAPRVSPTTIAQRTQPAECPYLKAETHFVFPKKNGPTYYGDRDVWLIDGTGLAVKRVTMETEVRFPQMSPSCDLFVCTDFGGYQRVYDTSGTLICKFYGADWATWTPDGRGLVYCRLKYNGDPGEVAGGDLFLYEIEDKHETQLTFSNDVAELRPTISPDGRQLAYMVRSSNDQVEIFIQPMEGVGHE